MNENIRALNYTEAEMADWSQQDRQHWKGLTNNNIFGVDHKKDARGRPIEQGIGSPDNPSENSFRAIGKYEGPEAEKAARAAAAARKKA